MFCCSPHPLYVYLFVSSSAMTMEARYILFFLFTCSQWVQGQSGTFDACHGTSKSCVLQASRLGCLKKIWKRLKIKKKTETVHQYRICTRHTNPAQVTSSGTRPVLYRTDLAPRVPPRFPIRPVNTTHTIP